ncbi:hypothetical protein D3C86_2123260 [compost metagenome]
MYFRIRNSGSRQTKVMYTAPASVRRTRILSIYRAVWSPGRMPGMKAPLFFRLSAVSRLLKTNAV